MAGDPFIGLTRLARADERWLHVWVGLASSLHLAVIFSVPRFEKTSAATPSIVSEVFVIDQAVLIQRPPPRTPEPPEEKNLPLAPSPSPDERPPPSERHASEVLTKLDDEATPIDFPHALETAPATTRAIGKTSSAGIGAGPVLAKATGASPTSPAGSGRARDGSRRASIAGGLEWNCPFPSEADGEGVDHASSTLRVAVSAHGRAERVTVLSDPGYGFGAAARRCALGKLYTPAHSADGLPTSDTLVVRVRFVR